MNVGLMCTSTCTRFATLADELNLVVRMSMQGLRRPGKKREAFRQSHGCVGLSPLLGVGELIVT